MEKPAVQVTDVIGNNINLASKAQTKDEALQELCHMLKQNGTVSDERLFYQDVLKREKNWCYRHGKWHCDSSR